MQSAPTKRIDIHAHGFPESYLRKLGDLYPGEAKLTQGPHGLVAYWAGAPLPVWTGGLRIEEMDRDGVTTEILSAPPIYTRLDERTAELCSLLNDFQAERAHEAPASFRSFLHLPVHDENASGKELARFAGDRTVAGVLFGSNMGGLYPGDRTLLPIWRMIHAAGLPVFIHPLYPAGCYGGISGPVVAFPCDTTLAAASIIYAGIFDQFPGIKIILAHYGGVLPFLALRLDMGLDVAGFPPGHGQDLPQLPSSYVGRFLADTAQGFHLPAFECARATLGIDHLLYGSDHFFVGNRWRARLNDFLDAHLTPDERAKVLWKNAEALLPCF